MTKVQRIGNILTAAAMLVLAWFLFSGPEEALPVIAIVLSALFMLRGLQSLVYYFSIARKMVGGKAVLYRGIILIDAGIFTANIADDSAIIIILYITVLHAISGLVNVMRAGEARKLGASWRFTAAFGITDVLLAAVVVVSGLYMHDLRLTVFIYSAGLIYSAILRIVSALRRSAIVYIQ